MGGMIICVAQEGAEFIHLKIGEGEETIPPGVKGYIDFDPGKCIQFTMNPDGSKTIKMPGDPKDAENAKLALEQEMSYVLSQFSGKPVEAAFDEEQGLEAKSKIQMFLCGEDVFLNLGTPANSLKEAEQIGTLKRCKMTTKMAYIEGVK